MTAPSLRRTALGWMTALLAGIGLAAMVVTYVLAYDEAAGFLDGQMRQVALNAGPGLADTRGPAPADQDPEDQIAVTIWRDGALLRGDRSVDPRRPERTGYADVVVGGARWRTYTAGDAALTVRVAQRDAVRAEFARNAAFGAVAPLLLLIPLSWIVVGWAMNRVLGQLDGLVQDLAGRSAAAAAPLPSVGVPIEIAPLVTAMNGLIVRLHAALDAQKRFVADAAHELRTPLAAMQIQVDALGIIARSGSRSAVEGDASSRESGQAFVGKASDAGSGAAEARALAEPRAALSAGLARASRLVDQLLRLARLDGPAPGAFAAIDFGPLLLDCVADHVPLAARRDIDLGAEIAEPARIDGVEAEIRVLLANLIDNALRYTPEGGRVDVRILREDGRPVVSVRDSGCGLPPGSEAHLFDRFFRAAPPDIEGTGLGLAIARRIAERHGLGLTVENRRDGQRGVLARIVLPD